MSEKHPQLVEESPDISRFLAIATGKMDLSIKSQEEVLTRSSVVNKYRNVATLLSLGILHIYSYLPMFLFSLFFPEWATGKGASGMWLGAITGIAFVTGAAAGFVNIKMRYIVSPTVAAIIGVVITGSFTTLFGFLDYIQSLPLFLAACMVVRAFQGFGMLLADSNVYVILNKQAPAEHLSAIVGTMDLLAEMSLAVSPLLGGLLFDAGGFKMTFGVIGGISLACVLFLVATTPPSEKCGENEERCSLREILSTFLNFSMVTFSITFLNVGGSVAFLNGMIQPHLVQFGLSSTDMGLLILVPCFSSSLTFPIWGLICDRTVRLEIISVTGNILLAIGFTFFGPVPGIPVSCSVPVIACSMAVCGFGMSASLTSVYTQGFRYLRETCHSKKLADAVLSACYLSNYCFGGFFGAILGGVFIDYVGYQWGSLILAILQVANIPLLLGRKPYLRRKGISL